MAKSPSTGGVQSIERGFEILEAMATESGPIGVSALAEQTGMPIPTIHRVIRTLLSLGYARQLPNRRYALGPRLIRLGESATQQFGTSSRTHLAELVEETGETAKMAVLDATMAVYVAQVPSAHSMRIFTEVGGRVRLHCSGIGKALLMQLPDSEVRALVNRVGMPQYTENTITDADTLIAELERSRERGYAIDEAERELWVRCFAVPVPNAPNVTAISVSGPAGRVTLDEGERIVPILQRVAKQLSRDFQREPQ
ncbi:MAG: IclR family transcriptional regulator [Mycobacterium sp.]